MPKLRKTLKILLDEKTDLKDRLNKLFPLIYLKCLNIKEELCEVEFFLLVF
jgi:hypothetical protein